jgi:hypothetical protein
VRRQPEQTVLHEVIREHLETFLRELSEDGRGLPRHVENEFRGYLRCGLLSEGWARCVCESCGDELLVAFSCKGKAFCPSCLARRMSDTSAHLVDRVLPLVPYRQWVLAYPRRLRLAFARDAKAATESATILLREVFRWQRKRARQAGAKRPRVAAVSFTQRFATRLDLNVHHHALLPDGAFTVGEDDSVGFVGIGGPRREDLETILERVVIKTLAMVERRGLMEGEPVDALQSVQADSLQSTLPLAVEEPPAKLSAFLEGFSLEAGVHVLAHDRPGLEHLLRYALRPPIALKRLHKMEDGRVLLELKRPINGVRAMAFTPRQLLRRLASIVPPPRVHSTRYWGVFAPSSKIRPKIIAPPQPEEERHGCREPGVVDEGGCEDAALADALAREIPRNDLFEGPPMPERPRRLPWADLLKRVWGTDVFVCDQCGGRRKLTAFMPDARQASEILERLGIDATAPPLAPARSPPHQEEFELAPPGDWVDPPSPDLP